MVTWGINGCYIHTKLFNSIETIKSTLQKLVTLISLKNNIRYRLAF